MNLNVRQRKVVEATEDKILCLAAAGSGKAILNSARIPTLEGWKRADEIEIGDYLINELGQPTEVLGVYPQGQKEVYKIIFGDGREAKCCKDHIWSVNKLTWKNKNEYRDYTITQLLEDGIVYKDRRAKFSIPCSLPIEWSEKKYDIDPYIIGVFLGDGCCIGKSQLVLASKDEDIPLLCAEKMGKKVKVEPWYNNKYQWRFYVENQNKKEYFNTIKYFEKYKDEILQYSYNKTIPEVYKTGSIEQRLSLVQGLMDTDGSIDKSNGQLRFTSTSLPLIKDMQEILNSLGYVSRLFQEKRKELYTNECYYILINIPNKEKEKLFRVKRKKDIASLFANISQRHDYSRTTIRSIEKLDEKEEMTCFYVDNPKHLFLMNDCIVTHNTTVLTERVRHLIEKCNVPPKEICAISFTNMAADEMKKRLGNIAIGSFIGTIHSLANNTCIANGINTEKYIADMEFDMILRKALTIPKGRYPKFTHLLIDEFQDTGQLEYSFIERIPTKNFFAVADERQAIYGFKGASDIYVRNLYHDAFCKVYYLNQNYRCAPNIISYADSLIASMDKLSPKTEAIKTKDGYVNEHSTFADALDELEWSQDWGNWFILTRTNNELATAITKLEERNIPYISFKKGDLDLIEMEALLKDNRVKVLTIHTAKGLENKNVIVTGARLYNEEERKIAYVAATRAEQSLYWCPSICRRGKIGRPDNRDDADAGKVFEKAAKNMISFG